MAVTNFGKMQSQEKYTWSMDFWEQYRQNLFLERFSGTGADSTFQKITELTKAGNGSTQAIITLVADLVGDGVAGDRTAKGNEEQMKSYDQTITYDMLRLQTSNEGRMADQKSVVRFREQARDKLAWAMADRCDQMAFLAMSGVAFTYKTDGTSRVGSDLPYLEFAADVTAPSTNRYLVWDATGFGVNTVNTSLTSADTPTWKMLVKAKAIAKTRFIRPRRIKGGIDFYDVFMTPAGMAALRQDADYLANVRNAGTRGETNELFKGTDTVFVDGLAIHEYHHVYHSATWGGGSVAGQRVLMCGAQAMGYVDLGAPFWEEESDDYNNRQGISIGKFIGFKKPVFYSNYHGTSEDFGVLAIDTAV